MTGQRGSVGSQSVTAPQHAGCKKLQLVADFAAFLPHCWQLAGATSNTQIIR
jgi:hypothetical protein